MSQRFIIALGILRLIEVLSAVSILVLAFTAPDYIFVSVIVFGTVVALRAGFLFAGGLTSGRFLSRFGVIGRNEQPLKFWAVAGLNAAVFLAGSLLTQVRRLSE